MSRPASAYIQPASSDVISHSHPNCARSFNLKQQSVPVPGSEKEGYTPVYRNSAVPELTTRETYYDVFNIGREKAHDRPCLGWRPFDFESGTFLPKYVWMTYDEVEEQRTAVASALAHLAASGKLGQGLPKSNWTVGIWCQNRPEWQIVDFANVAHSRQTVALYDTYDDDSALYVLNHSEAKVCFTTTSHISTLLGSADKLPHLRAIILLDLLRTEKLPLGELSRQQLARQWAAQKGLEVYSFSEILQLGRSNPVAHSPPQDNNVGSSEWPRRAHRRRADTLLPSYAARKLAATATPPARRAGPRRPSLLTTNSPTPRAALPSLALQQTPTRR